jgi:hypothetical protein
MSSQHFSLAIDLGRRGRESETPARPAGDGELLVEGSDMPDAAVTDTTTRSSADRRRARHRYQVWAVFRYPWVTMKLALVITVLLVGVFVIAPASSCIEQLS